MDGLDFSGLTDDQLVELARACCLEAARRSPAAEAAMRSMMIDEAERVTGRIDVLYVGPDGDRAAMDFLRRLARAGCGEFRCNDLAKAGQPALASTIGQLLLEHRR